MPSSCFTTQVKTIALDYLSTDLDEQNTAFSDLLGMLYNPQTVKKIISKRKIFQNRKLVL